MEPEQQQPNTPQKPNKFILSLLVGMTIALAVAVVLNVAMIYLADQPAPLADQPRTDTPTSGAPTQAQLQQTRELHREGDSEPSEETRALMERMNASSSDLSVEERRQLLEAMQ